MTNTEATPDPVLAEALSDLEYFKKKLALATGTDREQIAKTQCELLEDAIAIYHEHRCPEGISCVNCETKSNDAKSVEIISAEKRIEPNTFEPYIRVTFDFYPMAYQNDKIPSQTTEGYMGEDIVAAIKQYFKQIENNDK